MNIHDQDIYFKAKNEGISQGEYQAKVETAKNFLKMGLPIDKIVQGTGLSIEVVSQLKNQT